MSSFMLFSICATYCYIISFSGSCVSLPKPQLQLRYAHMTATAVTAGETVTAGQVIGYVGSTGDSTGNHLHFEVMQNGVLVAPVF